MKWSVRYHEVVAVNKLVDELRAAKDGEDYIVADVSSPFRRIPAHIVQSIKQNATVTLHLFDKHNDHITSAFIPKKHFTPSVCQTLETYMERFTIVDNEKFQAVITGIC